MTIAVYHGRKETTQKQHQCYYSLLLEEAWIF